MKTKLSLAVAAALFAAASSANAGISIPAGDWTVDIGGNVNAFYIYNNADDSNTVSGGLANAKQANGNDSVSSINTGLLPSWLGIGAKTRQNDLDVGFTISFQPGASSKSALGGGSGSEFRQAFLTFGDASWGTIKIGKDLGLFGSNAILNDQTLLGVGAQGIVGAAGGTTTTLGRIGTGFLYADFKGQINYTSPNWNGFNFTAGISQPWGATNLAGGLSAAITGGQESPAFEAQVQYAWEGDFGGKVWGEYWRQNVTLNSGTDDDSDVFGIGANFNVAGFGLTGYYYNGQGVGTTCLLCDGYSAAGKQRDSDGYYVQGSFTIPGVGTKLAASWGESKLDRASGEAASTLVDTNEMWTLGAYHPLTKHLNLVAEYSNVKAQSHLNKENKSDSVSLGAIMFF